jgi:hypothetical protein
MTALTFDGKDYAAFTGILVTLILGAYNAIQNYRSSRRTIFINTVTAERIKWLDKLRQSLSTFCGTAHFWRFSTEPGSPEERQKIDEIDKLRHLIALQLNPQGAVDKEIKQMVGEIVSMSARPATVSDVDYRNHLDRLTQKAQQLLKAEWDKVKDEARWGDLRDRGGRG